jgi:hypothetical protein
MSLPRNPDVSKKWFCYVGNENHMKLAAETWADSQRHNNYHFLPKSQPIFASVNEKDILMIYCHGSAATPDDKPVLWLKNFDKEEVEDPKTKVISVPKEFAYTPEKFLEFLKTQKLNPDHKVLKLAACYSDDFAKELSSICEADFPNLTIIGYREQLVLGQGIDGNILTGLATPLVKEDKDEEDREENEPIHWIINEDEFLKNREYFKKLYDEDRQQNKYKGGVKIEEEKPELIEEELSANNSGRQTRSSSRLDHTASRSSIDIESPRSSTSNIAGLLNLSLREEVNTPNHPNPLPNREISPVSDSKKPNFDQNANDDIIGNPGRRKSM